MPMTPADGNSHCTKYNASTLVCTLGLKTSLLMMAEAMTDVAPTRLRERGQSEWVEGGNFLHGVEL